MPPRWRNALRRYAWPSRWADAASHGRAGTVRGSPTAGIPAHSARRPLGPLVPCRSSVWAGLLGGTVDAEDDWHMVLVDGSARVGIQLAPDDVPPDCPHGRPQQIHLDLWVDDIDTAHEEVISLGAKLLQAAADSDEPDNFKVYADPAGHPFCLCWVKK